VVPFSTAAADQAAASLDAAKAEAEAQKQSAFFGTLITAGSILLGLLILALVIALVLRRRQKREPVDLGERLDLDLLPVMPAVSALGAPPMTSAIPITALPPMPPSPSQIEDEMHRLEIDSMVANNPEKVADYLRGLMDDRQSV
jgi:flagellar M-ring protein FliF